jgi:hypothetical protein
MSDGVMTGRLRASNWLVLERRDRVYDGGAREANPLDERTSIAIPLATVEYRLTPRVGLQASVGIPFIARTGVVSRPTGDTAFRDEVRGLGDLVAGAWYRGGSSGRWGWTVNAAFPMPTGATRASRFRNELDAGSLVPLSRLQRGTGTWDPVFGVSLERAVAGGRWVSSAAVRTPIGENRDGLRTGASWELGSGWAHTVKTHKVMAFARVDWLHREQDAFRGTPVLVGGGDWIYASPGIAVMVGRGVNVQADMKVPVYRNLANRQLDSRTILQPGVSRSF